MINFLICLIISSFISIGLSILIVEKGRDWPIKPWRIRLQIILRKIHWKLPQMLYCTTCTSFWAASVGDTIVGIVALLNGSIYFFWPFSGIIIAGFMWIIIEYLNTIDKDQDINVFIDKK
jgi:hypothetical protein